MNTQAQPYLFDLTPPTPTCRTWLLCRASAWPLPDLLDEAIAHYYDLHQHLPHTIRVYTENKGRTLEHLRKRQWSTIAVTTCAGILACECEIPHHQEVTQ